MNLEERRDVAHGPDNFIEPARFDGVQPTFFLEVPPGWHRHYCVFTINVPLGSEPVAWTLMHNGYEYTTPGHTRSINYKLDDTWYSADRGAGGEGGSIAPLVEFVEPEGSEHVGRAGSGARAEPVTATVGSPLTLSIAVTQPHIEEYMGDPKAFNVYWYKYQGPPGEVIFSESTIRLEGGDTVERKLATTTATFPAPGEYLLLVQALNSSIPIPVLLDQRVRAGDGCGVSRRRSLAGAAMHKCFLVATDCVTPGNAVVPFPDSPVPSWPSRASPRSL